MPSLPPAIVPLLSPFASLFDARTWRKVQILLTGVIPAPGRRPVSTALYMLGLHARGDFALFHHLLSRASWSSLAVSRVLPASWSNTWSRRDRCGWPSTRPRAALGEEERGPGGVPDPGRSSHGPFVKAKGLRWQGDCI